MWNATLTPADGWPASLPCRWPAPARLDAVCAAADRAIPPFLGRLPEDGEVVVHRRSWPASRLAIERSWRARAPSRVLVTYDERPVLEMIGSEIVFLDRSRGCWLDDLAGHAVGDGRGCAF